MKVNVLDPVMLIGVVYKFVTALVDGGLPKLSPMGPVDTGIGRGSLRRDGVRYRSPGGGARRGCDGGNLKRDLRRVGCCCPGSPPDNRLGMVLVPVGMPLTYERPVVRLPG